MKLLPTLLLILLMVMVYTKSNRENFDLVNKAKGVRTSPSLIDPAIYFSYHDLRLRKWFDQAACCDKN